MASGEAPDCPGRTCATIAWALLPWNANALVPIHAPCGSSGSGPPHASRGASQAGSTSWAGAKS